MCTMRRSRSLHYIVHISSETLCPLLTLFPEHCCVFLRFKVFATVDRHIDAGREKTQLIFVTSRLDGSGSRWVAKETNCQLYSFSPWSGGTLRPLSTSRGRWWRSGCSPRRWSRWRSWTCVLEKFCLSFLSLQLNFGTFGPPPHGL